MDRDFANWFCGFVDGEGCFSLHKSNDTKRYYPSFTIRLRGDDYDTLRNCQGWFNGIGCLSIHKNGQAQWKVSKAKEQMALVNFFGEYKLRAKKSREYEYWSMAVIEYQKKPSKRNARLMCSLKNILSELKKYHGDPAIY